jgi:hypothetical protein
MNASIEVQTSLARIATVLERLLHLVEEDMLRAQARLRDLETERVSSGEGD